MTNKAYIDEFGFHAPDYATILERKKQEFRDIWGQDLYLEPDSQDGAQVAITALAEHDTNTLAESVYMSFSPQTARGVGLSRMIKINGMSRPIATNSTAPVRLIGQAGVQISNGIVRDDAGNNWALPDLVVIPPSGEVVVTAVCTTTGEIRAVPGDINTIVTARRGWQEAYNIEPAIPGAPVEQDGGTRKRQTISTALPSQTILDGTRGAVAGLKGVVRSEVYENDTDKYDDNGIPPHHICAVVEGGDGQEIAQAIVNKKTPGCGTFGDAEVLTRDKYDCPTPIRFFRMKYVNVKVHLTIRIYQGYLATTGDRIIENLITFINSNPVGVDIMRGRLVCPVASAEPVKDSRTFDIDIEDFLLGSDSLDLGPHNIPVPFNYGAAIEKADITLTILQKNEQGIWVNA